MGLTHILRMLATLWLIHWQLATNINRATTWFWAFSIFGQNEFRKDTFISELIDWTQRNLRGTEYQKIRLNAMLIAFFRTYVPSRQTKTTIIEDTFDCPLVELNLISDSSDENTYRFHRGPKPSLPIEIFAAALSEFWDTFSEENTLTFADIAYSPRSPGRTFRLDEDTLVEYLDRLENLTEDALYYSETAGMKQVHRNRRINPVELLHRHYLK